MADESRLPGCIEEAIGERPSEQFVSILPSSGPTTRPSMPSLAAAEPCCSRGDATDTSFDINVLVQVLQMLSATTARPEGIEALAADIVCELDRVLAAPRAGQETAATATKMNDEDDTSSELSAELASLDDEEIVRVWRVERKFAMPFILCNNDTLLKALVGEQAADYLFDALRRLFVGRLFLALWIIGGLLAELCLFGVLPKRAAWAGWIGLPHIVLQGLLMHRTILKVLIKSFETWYLFAMALLWCILSFDVLRWDERCILIMLIFLSFAMTVFTDALHRQSVGRFSFVAIGLGVVFQLLWIACTHFGWYADLQGKQMEFGLPDVGSLSSSSVLLGNQRLVVVAAFFTRNLYSALRWPNRYVMLKAPMISEKVKVRALREELNTQRRLSKIRSASTVLRGVRG